MEIRTELQKLILDKLNQSRETIDDLIKFYESVRQNERYDEKEHLIDESISLLRELKKLISQLKDHK